MGFDRLFSFQLTFTHGLILGQLSIILLLAAVFKYLFLDTSEPSAAEGSSSFLPRLEIETPHTPSQENLLDTEPPSDSIEWLNSALLHIANVYRSKLRDDLPGAKGDVLMRQRVEEYVNKIRPKDMLDAIRVHAVDLGLSAPRLSNARLETSQGTPDSCSSPTEIGFQLSYADTISLSFSTAYLFNYPTFGFARLPISISITLSRFASSVVVSPPTTTSVAPALTLTIPPTFVLELKTTSLLGSRAKLADVPKLHELIADQIRRQLIRRGTIKIPLPGLSSAAEVRQELNREMFKAG